MLNQNESNGPLIVNENVKGLHRLHAKLSIYAQLESLQLDIPFNSNSFCYLVRPGVFASHAIVTYFFTHINDSNLAQLTEG